MWKAEYMLQTLYRSIRLGRKFQAEIPELKNTLDEYKERSKIVTHFKQNSGQVYKIQTIQPRQISYNPISFDEGPFYDVLYVYTCKDTFKQLCEVDATKVPISVEDIGEDISNATLESFGYLIVSVNDSEKFVHQQFFEQKDYEVITDRRQMHDLDLLYILILKRKNESITVYIIYKTWSIFIYATKEGKCIHPFFKQFFDARLVIIPGVQSTMMGNDVDSAIVL